MHIGDIHPTLPTWTHALNDRLATLFTGEHAALAHAATTVVSSRGKRLRPLWVLLACASFGEVSARTIDQAMMVELIHTASLAHDDVVDEADARRGAPSAPARWGNKFSILLGDYLFARVFELATADGDPEVLRILASTATEMGRAVSLELVNLNLDAEEDIYWRVIHGKTAVLFAAAAAIGARVGGADVATEQVLYRAGQAFGTAFQLADDLLDLQEPVAERGKPHGIDCVQRRATLPILHTLRSASPTEAAELRALWTQEPFTDEHLVALRCRIAAAGGFDYGWQKVKEYLADAGRELARVPDSPARTALQRLCGDAFPLPVMPAAV